MITGVFKDQRGWFYHLNAKMDDVYGPFCTEVEAAGAYQRYLREVVGEGKTPMPTWQRPIMIRNSDNVIQVDFTRKA